MFKVGQKFITNSFSTKDKWQIVEIVHSFRIRDELYYIVKRLQSSNFRVGSYYETEAEFVHNRWKLIPETKWVNIYLYQDEAYGTAYPTKEEADVAAEPTRVACVEFTEGKYV